MSVLGGRGTNRADELLFSVGDVGERGECDELKAEKLNAVAAMAEAGTAWWTWAFWCGMCAKSVDCAPDDDDAPLLGSGAL